MTETTIIGEHTVSFDYDADTITIRDTATGAVIRITREELYDISDLVLSTIDTEEEYLQMDYYLDEIY